MLRLHRATFLLAVLTVGASLGGVPSLRSAPQTQTVLGLTQYTFGTPSGDETEMLAEINRARANPPAEGQRLAALLDPASYGSLQSQYQATGQEMIEDSEVEMDDFDVRDAPKLAVYAERLGYQHGYAGKPLRFSCFASIMLRAHGHAYPDLEPNHYESYYVGGHMRGENDVVQLIEYAINYGETRALGAPVMAGHWRPLYSGLAAAVRIEARRLYRPTSKPQGGQSRLPAARGTRNLREPITSGHKSFC